MRVFQSPGLNNLSWCLTLFTNTIQLPYSSNTNLPQRNLEFLLTVSSLYSPLMTIFLNLPAPHHRQVFFSAFFSAFKHCGEATSCREASWVLSSFHFPPVSECFSKQGHEDIFGAKHYPGQHWWCGTPRPCKAGDDTEGVIIVVNQNKLSQGTGAG